MLMKFLFAGLASALTARAAYPAWTRMRAAQRERATAWRPDGVRVGAAPFELGEGRVAILCIHGFASSPSVFSHMATELAQRGYAVRAMRLPGFGERLERMLRVDESDWQRTLADEVRDLRRTHDTVWLMGHSMGATLALDLAQTDRKAVDGLALIAPLIQVSTRRSLGLPPETLFAVAEKILTPDTILGTAFPVDLHAKKEGVAEDRDRFLPMSMYSAMFRLTRRVRSRPTELNIPTLIVVPGSDKVVSRRACLKFYEDLRAPRKKLVHAPNAGHVIPLDYGWQEIVRSVVEFVEAAEAPTTGGPPK